MKLECYQCGTVAELVGQSRCAVCFEKSVKFHEKWMHSNIEWLLLRGADGDAAPTTIISNYVHAYHAQEAMPMATIACEVVLFGYGLPFDKTFSED